MKKIILIALLAIASFVAKAQQDTTGFDIPMKDGRIVYEGIVETPNLAKMDLYNNAKQWFVDYFNSSKDVIQNEDKDQGRIIGKGIIFIYRKTISINGAYDDRITVQIDLKDGKYRYKIYNMTITEPAPHHTPTGESPPRQFLPEDMVNKLNGKGKLFLTDDQCTKLLASEDKEVKSTIASLQKAMSKKPDSF